MIQNSRKLRVFSLLKSRNEKDSATRQYPQLYIPNSVPKGASHLISTAQSRSTVQSSSQSCNQKSNGQSKQRQTDQNVSSQAKCQRRIRLKSQERAPPKGNFLNTQRNQKQQTPYSYCHRSRRIISSNETNESCDL